MTAAADTLLPPRAILFDWDNTLVDTWPCITRAVNVTLRAMDMEEWSDAECRERIGLSMRDSFPGLFGDRWEEARDVFYAAFRDFHIDMLAVLPGSESMLRELHRHGVWLGVVSNKTGAFLRAEARHLGWTDLFGRLVGAGDAARDKPAIEPVHMALDGSGIAPGADVWFVGDNLVDMQCGVAAGCPPILLHPEPPGKDAFPGCAPRRIFRDCEQFMGYVRSLAVPIS